ncbi:MAG: hypothetical protein E2604_07050 [Flavobacterium sp.]|jgi:hypothetical protein|nr:hypothetical protein [Flavobacterium sp.]HRB73272.1 hypothetical protein [Flavobacterium sp.]
MKNVKKLLGLTAIASALFFSTDSQAQSQGYEKGWRVGFGLNGGIPINSSYDFSLGADARLQYDLTQKTSLAATTGYTHLFSKDADGGFIPAKLGFKSFLGNQIYVLGEVGAGIGVKDGMGTSFLWAPGIGIATKNIDISLRYEDYNHFNTGQVSLRLAYGFKL